MPQNATIEDWIRREGFSFSLGEESKGSNDPGSNDPGSNDPPGSFDAGVDRMVAALGASVHVLGLGEPTHGVEAFLRFRNRVFRRLVERHGFTAIAIEGSFPRGWRVEEYVAGREDLTFERIAESGFSHGFGRSPANRELVEWMRAYNASHQTKVHFYGFDSPTEMTAADSPRALLHAALDYLATVDDSANDRRARIDRLLGDDAAWEDPAAMFDPSKSIGGSERAAALRVETEDLIDALRADLAAGSWRRPTAGGGAVSNKVKGLRTECGGKEASSASAPPLSPKSFDLSTSPSTPGGGQLLAAGDDLAVGKALQHALVARHMLDYHAALARPSKNRTAELLGIRDLIMADNLAFIAMRARGGKTLAFAHNSHLQRGQASWQLGPDLLTWRPAGAHVDRLLGDRYAVIGMGVGACESMKAAPPEAGTLEQRLSAIATSAGGAASGGSACFVPTHRGAGIDPTCVDELPTRRATNPGYFPFTSKSVRDLDGLLVLAWI